MKYKWEPIKETTPSGKRLFQCTGCKTRDPAPTKHHDCVATLIMKLQMYRRTVEIVVGEAEYAMVGGNDIKEPIPWETADSWFEEIYKKIRAKKWG